MVIVSTAGTGRLGGVLDLNIEQEEGDWLMQEKSKLVEIDFFLVSYRIFSPKNKLRMQSSPRAAALLLLLLWMNTGRSLFVSLSPCLPDPAISHVVGHRLVSTPHSPIIIVYCIWYIISSSTTALLLGVEFFCCFPTHNKQTSKIREVLQLNTKIVS